jgi:hypothetical protein
MLALAKHSSFEALESYHDHRHIIKGLSIEGVLEGALYCKTTLLVHILSSMLLLFLRVSTSSTPQVAATPHAVVDVLV